MNLSIRNELPGTVTEVTRGEAMATVGIRLTDGPDVTAAVTRDAVDALGLAAGRAVRALAKSTEVSLATGPVTGLSIRNQLPGAVASVAAGEAMAEFSNPHFKFLWTDEKPKTLEGHVCFVGLERPGTDPFGWGWMRPARELRCDRCHDLRVGVPDQHRAGTQDVVDVLAAVDVVELAAPPLPHDEGDLVGQAEVAEGAARHDGFGQV